MDDCKHLEVEDITPWHGDVYSHPVYRYICKLTGKEVVVCVHCNSNKCEHYQ